MRRISLDAGGHQERAPGGDYPFRPRVLEFLRGQRGVPHVQEEGPTRQLTFTNDQFTVKGQKVHIPKLGSVRMHESLPPIGKVLDGTISRIADRWFLSVAVEILDPPGSAVNDRLTGRRSGGMRKQGGPGPLAQ